MHSKDHTCTVAGYAELADGLVLLEHVCVRELAKARHDHGGSRIADDLDDGFGRGKHRFAQPCSSRAGRALRGFNPAIKLISFQPEGPFHGLEGLKHMALAIVPTIYDASLADEDLRVSTEAAHTMVRRLAKEEGLLAGISSGAALAATLEVASRLDHGVVVTVFPDGAEKYLSEYFWTADQ